MKGLFEQLKDPDRHEISDVSKAIEEMVIKIAKDLKDESRQ